MRPRIVAPEHAGVNGLQPLDVFVDRVTLAFGAVSLASLAVLVLAWARMIVSPAPQEMREGAVLWTTSLFLSGDNPYAIGSPPGAANLYGPLYPLLVAAVATLLGPTLLAHRLVNAVGIAIACGLMYRILRRAGASPITASIGAGLNLAGLLYWVGPTARPDGVGMALSLGAYAVLAPAPDNARRFAWGLLLSLAGFAAKIYYVLPVFVAVIWMLARRDFRRGFAGAFVACAALALTIDGLAFVFPTWAPVVLGANLHATSYDKWHLLGQSRDWAIFSLPLLVALVGAWSPLRARRQDAVFEAAPGAQAAHSAAARKRSGAQGPPRATKPGSGAEPQLIWVVALVVGAAAILVALGGHRGAHMTYFFHLVSPALTVVALRRVDERTLPRLAFAASLPVTLIANSHWFSFDLARLERAEATFAMLANAIDQAHRPTGTGEFAPLLLAAGVRPIETGHTEYVRYARVSPLRGRLWHSAEPLEADIRRLTRFSYAAVRTGSFDLVLANRRKLDVLTPEVLWDRYRVARQIDIDMPWTRQAWPVDVWVPVKGR